MLTRARPITPTLICKYGDPQYVYPVMGVNYYVSQAVTNLMLLHDAATETTSVCLMTSGWRDAILFGVGGV
jgi:hypothetical protein